MKILLIGLICLMGISGCTNEVEIDGKDISSNPNIPDISNFNSNIAPNIPATPMPGGYQKQDVASEDIKKIAEEVVVILKKEKNFSLVKIHLAATQVVAGLNYFFRLEVKMEEKIVFIDVIAFKALDGTLSITKKEELK
mgnify:CR=1 FL=1